MERMITQGISADDSGHVSVDADAGRLLIELAIDLEASVTEPVDVQHVLAAIVLAARDGLVDDQTRMSRDNDVLRNSVIRYLPVVLERFGDQLGSELD
jgi:hypothetical protein